MLHLKLLEEQEKAKPKTSRSGEILKIKAKISELETTTTKKNRKNQQTKSWFFEKRNKIDRSLTYLIKMRRKKLQSVKSEIHKGR
jgi:hypothetical protein